MSIWEKYSEADRKAYIQFLQLYGALSNLFRQKHGDLIPYLDSKFQETIFAKIFKSENVDIGNTPHDILSVFGDERIGIGLKTWMNSSPSFQKVMQLKRYKNEIDPLIKYGDLSLLAQKISSIKNEKMISDYERLGLSEDSNIYHYITRDEGTFKIHESSYPLVQLDHLQGFKATDTAFHWNDGLKEYKYTYSDSQIWQRFDSSKPDTLLLETFSVDIINNPFDFLMESYTDYLLSNPKLNKASDIVEVFLPLYSFREQEVPQSSGLNAWNGAPKSKNSQTLRPLNEVYIPIPRDFHISNPDFFIDDIFKFEKYQKQYIGPKENRPQLRFRLVLPNGKEIPAMVCQDRMKSLQSGSQTEIDPSTGKRYGQSALGQWLLVDVLGLKERTLVTRNWLEKKGTDSVRLWRKKEDYSKIHIDIAPIGSFEKFMNPNITTIE